MINGTQVKMARAALGWGVRELAEKAGLNPNTISRLENGGGIQAANLEKIEKVLIKAGIEFIPENGGGAGVRLKKS